MSGPVKCPRCGTENFPELRFCAKCDARLVDVRLDGEPRPPPEWAPSTRRTGVDRTKTGLLLVIVGLILQPVPYILYIGIIVAIIGVIMVIIGRYQFGTRHSNLVIGSVVAYCIGLVIGLVAVVVFGFSLVQAVLRGGSQAQSSQSLIDGFNGVLIATLVSGMVIAAAYVMFTYALQDSSGRLLLYTAFAVQLAVGVFAVYTVSGQVANAASQSFPGGTFDPNPLKALQSQLQYLELTGLIPAGLFAFAYYRVYSRISKGELPQPTTQPSPIGPS